MLGIVEEQHPDRTRLFMKWQRMDWPIMVDSLNLLGVSAVPTTFLIDEAGIIQAVQPTDDQFRAFLAAPPTSESPTNRSGRPEEPDFRTLETAVSEGTEGARVALADALFLWSRDETALDRAIELYSSALEEQPKEGSLHFRLGVAYKKRSEVKESPDDFKSAVEHWRTALDLNPNQYIWRRRIQQYGPRLDKPYSFYDWIHEARREITDRGETPVALNVEPGGAEFAYPAQAAPEGSTRAENPDPRGRIFRDTGGLVRVQQIVVPDTSRGNRVVRVHLEFQPNPALKAHWNNEAGDMVVWVDPPEGWKVDSRLILHEVPPKPVSAERRSIEFELEGPDGFQGSASGSAYALYYVCEDVDGTCLYRRQDIPIDLQVEGRE
jgi:hypothetical protein